MKVNEIYTDDRLISKAHDLLLLIGDKVQENYNEMLSVGNEKFLSRNFPVLYNYVIEKSFFGFKYKKRYNPLFRVDIDDNKINIYIFDGFVFNIVKEEFTKFAESNNIEEINFVKNFDG